MFDQLFTSCRSTSLRRFLYLIFQHFLLSSPLFCAEFLFLPSILFSLHLLTLFSSLLLSSPLLSSPLILLLSYRNSPTAFSLIIASVIMKFEEYEYSTGELFRITFLVRPVLACYCCWCCYYYYHFDFHLLCTHLFVYLISVFHTSFSFHLFHSSFFVSLSFLFICSSAPSLCQLTFFRNGRY
jgi:hypothetical protein